MMLSFVFRRPSPNSCLHETFSVVQTCYAVLDVFFLPFQAANSLHSIPYRMKITFLQPLEPYLSCVTHNSEHQVYTVLCQSYITVNVC